MKYRLHYLATVLGALHLSLPSAFATVNVVQKDYNNAVVEDQHDFTLSELKEALSLTMKDHDGANFLTFNDTTATVDSDSIFQLIDQAGHGGPSGITFLGNVRFNFNEPLLFQDNQAGFMLGVDVDNGFNRVSSNLTIDLQQGFLSGLNWNNSEDVDMYYYTFFMCQYFDNSSQSTFDVLLNGQSSGAMVGEYEYVGYVRDPNDVQKGQIAVIPVTTSSTGHDGLMPGWEGQALSLVAKPQVGWDAPSLPEPATGTLSLLALAGLAARRRRK